MRLQITKSKNAQSLYIVKSTYSREKKHSNKIVKKLGTYAELLKTHEDPIAWGKEVAKQMTEEEKESKKKVALNFSPNKKIEINNKNRYNVGYLFLEKLYYESKLNVICKEITNRYKFDYDLNDILQKLIYTRIISPGSKNNAYEQSQNFLEVPKFSLQNIYRSLEVLCKEMDYIQSKLYLNSTSVLKNRSNILYYDCTNYFFEIEQADGIKQYGVSKENKPNPIVQMGLFIDGDGIPLSFCLNPGNTNEQGTLIPLEQKIFDDFKKERVIVCTDAGLSSIANRKFNSFGQRNFITVQSVKKMKSFRKDWVFDNKNWYMLSDEKKIKVNLEEIIGNPDLENKYYNAIFYKDEWMKDDDGFEQRYILSYSIKYREYLRNIRNQQITRAKKIIDNGNIHTRQNDPKTYIQITDITEQGEIAENKILSLDEEKVFEEEKYDGYYCVATDLEDDVRIIIDVNKRRWEIEESFRIMKTEFKARQVYLRKEDRITAHFLTCFLALYIFRLLELRTEHKYTCEQLIKTLRDMDMVYIDKEGYIPAYTRTEITDCLHKKFGFNTDYEFTSLSNMRKIFSLVKKP